MARRGIGDVAVKDAFRFETGTRTGDTGLRLTLGLGTVTRTGGPGLGLGRGRDWKVLVRDRRLDRGK